MAIGLEERERAKRANQNANETSSGRSTFLSPTKALSRLTLDLADDLLRGEIQSSTVAGLLLEAPDSLIVDPSTSSRFSSLSATEIEQASVSVSDGSQTAQLEASVHADASQAPLHDVNCDEAWDDDFEYEENRFNYLHQERAGFSDDEDIHFDNEGFINVRDAEDAEDPEREEIDGYDVEWEGIADGSRWLCAMSIRRITEDDSEEENVN